ncbi:Putative cobalt-precorrin-6A synthase [deacetylating] [Gossypium arboreum]|uniref:Putative cobalt-precorrin-6A synthase [deacetylating] n=1 Tax=Gossypium arboreum TaxID=29729 RepID=A0A0B0PIW2_GOSAR|nr:Putative cobalt-precorrin-6A synthase [deacetylating] [Gossypium arboreum]
MEQVEVAGLISLKLQWSRPKMIKDGASYLRVLAMEEILATSLISLRSKMVNLISMYWQSVKQIKDGESYLHILAMEQILATSLISLR